MIPFKPIQRFGHTATLINDKLYIIGGVSINLITLNDFFYLDVSAAFNTQNLPWVVLSSSITIVPPHFGAVSVKGGVNNNTLFLYGGFTENNTTLSFYTFDTQSNSWNIPKIANIVGYNIPKKGTLSGIIDRSGKMYLWGGSNGTNSVNDMFILDTIKLIGRVGSSVNAPTPRVNYGVVLLPNNNIIYFGGYNAEIEAELTLDQVYIYDTINDSWDIKTAKGKVPSSRDGFSVILGLDGSSVIIFGGTATYSDQGLAPDDSIYELNLFNFEWIIPKISNTSQIPNSRMYHKANVIGKYMVISFGLGYDPSIESDILLLDISNKTEYVWTNTFLNSQTVPNKPVQPAQSMQKVKLIGIIIGSSISITLVSFGVFFLYKWKKKTKCQKYIASIPHILSDC
ncbi:hypothetical protein C1645_790557 [Glomus cerebriforme]|uniref:Galactose oxidase n=1 Tax=Glomus cerebriforme TaxID=658196 RepID=A0A397S4P9_9GLOM|nr:hypothetical protein C1645_790557 [Glomus cerebriforme]